MSFQTFLEVYIFVKEDSGQKRKKNKTDEVHKAFTSPKLKVTVLQRLQGEDL